MPLTLSIANKKPTGRSQLLGEIATELLGALNAPLLLFSEMCFQPLPGVAAQSLNFLFPVSLSLGGHFSNSGFYLLDCWRVAQVSPSR